MTPVVPSFWARIERKVKAAALGAFAASLAAAVLNALLSGSVVPSTPHAWGQFLIVTLAPPVVAAISGWSTHPVAVPPKLATVPKLPTQIVSADELRNLRTPPGTS